MLSLLAQCLESAVSAQYKVSFAVVTQNKDRTMKYICETRCPLFLSDCATSDIGQDLSKIPFPHLWSWDNGQPTTSQNCLEKLKVRLQVGRPPPGQAPCCSLAQALARDLVEVGARLHTDAPLPCSCRLPLPDSFANWLSVMLTQSEALVEN